MPVVLSISKEENRGEHMAHNTEPQPTHSWTQTFRESAGALVVAAILAAFTLGGTAWVTIIGLDNDVTLLKKEMGRGGRYTMEMHTTEKEIQTLLFSHIDEGVTDLEEEHEEMAAKVEGHLRLSDKKVSEYDLKLQSLTDLVKELGRKCESLTPKR